MNIIHTVDGIIRYQKGIVVIERNTPPIGLALPGGKVGDHHPDETLEQALEREVGEEVGLKLANIEQFKTYSEPGRDPRGRYISTVFTADGYGKLRALDGAKRAFVIDPRELSTYSRDFAFDHYKILCDYAAIMVRRCPARAYPKV